MAGFDFQGAAGGAAGGASSGAAAGPWGAGIGGVLGGLAGGLFGGSSKRKQADKLRQQALEDLLNSRPEMENSAFDTISTDPALRQAQLDALRGLQAEGNAGGLTVQSRAALNEANALQAQRERGSREAILQGMSQRGMGGSGTELAAALQNQQASADRSALAGTQAAADARQRALQAMSASGEMAGGIRGQDFGEAATKAQARDARNRFNASQRLTRAGMTANVRTGNAAAADRRGAEADEFASGLSSGLGQLAGQAYTGLFGGKK